MGWLTWKWISKQTSDVLTGYTQLYLYVDFLYARITFGLAAIELPNRNANESPYVTMTPLGSNDAVFDVLHVADKNRI